MGNFNWGPIARNDIVSRGGLFFSAADFLSHEVKDTFSSLYEEGGLHDHLQ